MSKGWNATQDWSEGQEEEQKKTADGKGGAPAQEGDGAWTNWEGTKTWNEDGRESSKTAKTWSPEPTQNGRSEPVTWWSETEGKEPSQSDTRHAGPQPGSHHTGQIDTQPKLWNADQSSSSGGTVQNTGFPVVPPAKGTGKGKYNGVAKVHLQPEYLQ